MNAEDSFEFTKTTLDTIDMGIKVYKQKLSELKNKFYDVIKRLMESLMSSKDKFTEEISKMEENYRDIEKSMDNCRNTDDENLFFTANEIFLNFSSLNHQYKQLVENRGSKYFSQILEEINFFSQNQMNSLIRIENSEKWSLNLRNGFRSKSPSIYSSFTKCTKRETEDVNSLSYLNLQKNLKPVSKQKTISSSGYQNNNFISLMQSTRNKNDNLDRKIISDLNPNLSKHKTPGSCISKDNRLIVDSKICNFVCKKNFSLTESESKPVHSSNIYSHNLVNKKEEISICQILDETPSNVKIIPNIKITPVFHNQLISDNKNIQNSCEVDDREKFLNKKRRKSESPILIDEDKKLYKSEIEIINKLKKQFPNYQIDFMNFLPCLKKKIIQSYEFNLLNACKLEKKIKESSISSMEDKAYILIKISTAKQELCNSSSMLYVNLQEFFENRYATFKNSDFMIGGILKENNNFLLIFQYLSENKFMNEFRINSINLSQYHFLEDIMTDIDEFNSKRVVHNIEKKDFKKRKELQEMLSNLRDAYSKISE